MSWLDEKFFFWLSGFIDAEGSFIIYRNGRRNDCKFSLTQRGDKIDLLQLICDWTELGSTRLINRSGRNPEAVWNIARRSECEALTRLLAQYPLRAKKARDLTIWQKALKDDKYRQSTALNELRKIRIYQPLTLPQSSDQGFLPWLGGFVDGEGCFGINRVRSRGEYSGYACNFQLRVRDDDSSIMKEIYQRTKIGSLRFNPHGLNSQICWSFWSKLAASKFSELIEDGNILLWNKKNDYAIWYEALQYWLECDGKHHNSSTLFDWQPMERLRNELMMLRKYPTELA